MPLVPLFCETRRFGMVVTCCVLTEGEKIKILISPHRPRDLGTRVETFQSRIPGEA